MANKEEFMRQLGDIRDRLYILKDDADAQKLLKEIVELEIDLYSFLLALGNQKTPSAGIRFDIKAEEKTGKKWQDIVPHIFNKVNSLLSKVLPI